MKKIFTVTAILFVALSFSGCEEKSDIEKAQDSMKEALQHTKDAIKDSTK